MRPVVRGDLPVDDAGDPKVFADYKEARDDLIDRMGDFCSYCEVALHSTIDVEHVLPKSLNPALELTWTNFLLACTNCNSIKGNQVVDLADFYWPDQDNTLRAFVYEQDEPPRISGDAGVDSVKAQSTLELTGLDRAPGHPRLSNRDRRWQKRFEAWSIALIAKGNLGLADSIPMRETIVLLARGIGFWSVWLAAFHDDVDMRRRFIQGLPGTANDCFDVDTNVLPRPGGAL